MPSAPAPRISRYEVAFKALKQLGPCLVAQYARYQFGLRSGFYRLVTSSRRVGQVQRWLRAHPQVRLSTGLFPLPSPRDLSICMGETGAATLLSEAEEVLQGRMRLFGADPVPLDLVPASPLHHWTWHARRLDGPTDVKFTWEPARFGWAIILARAYLLTGDERYPKAFWDFTERFMAANPPYLGPNWVSAQEVALRLVSLVFAYQVFAASPLTSPSRADLITEAVALHAFRIPPTLAYAQAQANNHLLSEAAGLLTAGLALPAHSRSSSWHSLGWNLFNRGVLSQFDQDGAYTQHSANYHRLALQLALWLNLLQNQVGHHVGLPTSEPGNPNLIADRRSGRCPDHGSGRCLAREMGIRCWRVS